MPRLLNMFSLIIVLLTTLWVTCAPLDGPTVLTSSGNITGQINAFNKIEFIGIRYATAERWKSPIRVNSSTIPSRSIYPVPGCPQICQLSSVCPETVSEDCLFLNVWTPYETFSGIKRPVLIYIHGGSFKLGTGYIKSFEELSISLNAIVVSINYRLSIFGFLDVNQGNSLSSINFGIQDQREALLWIKENIGNFGGDMTVLGQSAGALSVLIHRAHPATKDIVSNMILMSPPFASLTTRSESRKKAQDLAKSLCQPSDLLYDCLSTKSTSQLLNALVNNKDSQVAVIDTNLIPVVDGVDILDEPFNILNNRRFMSNTNLILGLTSNETWSFINEASPGFISFAQFKLYLDALFPQYTRDVILAYSDITQITRNQKENLIRATTDALFTCPIHSAQRSLASFSNLFSYTFESPWTGSDNTTFGDLCKGYSCHTTDLVYLLDSPSDGTLSGLSTLFRKYISRFVETGDPNANDLPSWPQKSRFILNANLLNAETLDSSMSRCELWDTMDRSLGVPSINTKLTTLTISIMLVLLIFLLAAQVVIFIKEKVKNKRIIKIFNGIVEYEENCSNAFIGIPREQMFFETPEPIVLSCSKLSLHVKDKTILNSLSFECFPGSLTAIMGPSGCGKTTLLSLLSGSNRSYVIKSIRLGATTMDRIKKEKLRSSIGYVSQHDPPFTGLTPHQVLTSYAKLETGSSRNSSVIVARKVHEMLNMMNLSECAHVLIMDPSQGKRGISGGQLKRLAIATVLLRTPSILILDEPTSGLDSKNTLEVMQVLSQLASRGHTILCSIHQPRVEVFELFSEVMVMAQGNILYKGQPKKSYSYFESIANANNIRVNTNTINPADFILDIAGSVDPKALSGYKYKNPRHSLKLDIELIDFSRMDVKLVPIEEQKLQVERAKSEDLTLVDSDSNAENDLIICQIHTPSTSNSSGDSFSIKDLSSLKSDGFYDPNKEKHVCDATSIINGRCWSTKPSHRKFMVFYIAILVGVFLSFFQRREGRDIISFGLQMKGLIVACVGLPAIKNISISSDFYRDVALYKFDASNGTVSYIAFFLHRFLYETTINILESTCSFGLSYFILDCNPELGYFLSSLIIFTVYYNSVISMFTCLFSTRLGRVEASSLSFVIQAFLTISSGLWIQPFDTTAYTFLAWMQYMNPMYWGLLTLISINSKGAGECLAYTSDGSCSSTVGDLFLIQLRIPGRETQIALYALLGIWVIIKSIQFLLLAREAYGFGLSKK